MKLSYIFSKKAFLNFQEMKLFKKFSFISGGKFNWPHPSKFLMFFPKKPFLKKFLTFCKIELSRSQLKKLFIFHKNGAFLYFLKKKKRFFLYFRRKLSKLKKISSLKFFFKFQEMELSLYFLKKSFFFYFRRGLSIPILQNFL